MLKSKRKYLSLLVTLFIIMIIVLIATYFNIGDYFLSNISHLAINPECDAEKIINNKYNSTLEGSVLDNIYNYDAKIVAIKEHLTLHKQIALSPSINLPENYPTIIQKNIQYDKNNQTETKKFNSNYYTNISQYNKYIALGGNIKEKVLLNYEEASKEVIPLPESKQSNRFEGLVEDYKKQETKGIKNSGKIIPLIKNWDSSRVLTVNKIKGGVLNVSNIFEGYDQNNSINSNIIRYSEDKKKFTTDVVKDFSKDPLKSVIQKVLVPRGLPKTPANVDAVAKSMGLPSGALGSSDALASSLGISIEELSNPNTKLPSSIVLSINKNKSYLGQELNIKNTTLGQFYNHALDRNLFSGLNNIQK